LPLLQPFTPAKPYNNNNDNDNNNNGDGNVTITITIIGTIYTG